MGNGAVLRAMENRTRLFHIVRVIPYALAILLSIVVLYAGLPEVFRPFEGAYYYEEMLFAFLCFLLICSAFAKGAIRSVLVLISSASLFSTGLVSLFKRLHDFPIRPPDGGPIYMNVWVEIAVLGLFFIVMAIEAAMLIGSHADRP